MSHESLATQGHNSDDHLVISLGPIHYRKQGFIRRIQYIRRYPKPFLSCSKFRNAATIFIPIVHVTPLSLPLPKSSRCRRSELRHHHNPLSSAPTTLPPKAPMLPPSRPRSVPPPCQPRLALRRLAGLTWLSNSSSASSGACLASLA
jgi:hypothetical protein